MGISITKYLFKIFRALYSKLLTYTWHYLSEIPYFYFAEKGNTLSVFLTAFTTDGVILR